MLMKEIKLIDIAKNKWQEDREGYGMWISIFEVPYLSKETLGESKVIELEDKIVVLSYFDSFPITEWQEKVTLDSVGDIQLQNPKSKMLKNKSLLLIITKGGSSEKRFNTIISEEVAAIVAICMGKNMVSRYITDSFLFFEGTGHVAHHTLNTGLFEKPNITCDSMNLVSLIDERLSKLQEKQKKNKVKLSLRWYYMALKETGVDAVLKLWIAIEAIGKENFKKDTNIMREINESFMEVYGMEKKNVKEYFEIGNLFGIRSDIVHQGQFVDVDGKLCSYMEAIYIDLLYHNLKLESLQLAGNFKKTQEIDIASYTKH